MTSTLLLLSLLAVLFSSLSAFKMPAVSPRVPLRSASALRMTSEHAIFKKDLVEHLSNKFELKKTLAKKILNELVQVISSEVMLNDKEVRLQNFGTFNKAVRAERRARNVQTGEPIDVPSCSVLRFKPSQKMRIYAGEESKLPVFNENDEEGGDE